MTRIVRTSYNDIAGGSLERLAAALHALVPRFIIVVQLYYAIAPRLPWFRSSPA